MKIVNVLEMIDVKDPDVGVSIEVSQGGGRLWVNVDGICVCRIQGIHNSHEGLRIVIPTQKDVLTHHDREQTKIQRRQEVTIE